MEKSGEQMKKGGESEEKGKLQGLPLESSPYMQYNDLEDYKRQGYGTEGHLQPQPGRGAGSTDAPTLSGGGAPPDSQANHSATGTINRQGVP
ncbi:hypothetical protein RJ639_034949 [Escallonia herrerae]|uniref:Late embryogenesis abundant protein, LEA-18 n=1 Tax=Escallonia herrerae TaxID=1293975 RepID=A0AA88WRR4_9ASTE|nr:hypothetical protein RJ639_034949 [Escallonia herrerae]